MARLPNNLTLTEQEVSQTFNLLELTGVDLQDQDDLKNKIAQDLIDAIVRRSESGTDRAGSSFKPYKKSYINSEQFEAFDKNASQVNMRLSGGMLASMEPLNTAGNDIKIGWNDPTENAKAYNHNKGETVTKREFFGLTKEQVKEVLSKYKKDIDKIKQQSQAPDAVTQFINNIGQFDEAQEQGTVFISLEDLFG